MSILRLLACTHQKEDSLPFNSSSVEVKYDNHYRLVGQSKFDLDPRCNEIDDPDLKQQNKAHIQDQVLSHNNSI